MKRHVKYIIYFILTIIIIIGAGLGLLTNQFFKFYDSYINEEKEEIQHQILMVKWAITPIIEENNIIKLKTFCNELKDNDIAVFIQDYNGKLLASSRPDISVKRAKNSNLNKKLFKNYEYTIKNKMVAKEETIEINNHKYIIRIALLQDNMITTFLKNQHSIILFFLISILLILAISLYVVFYLKLPFDKLQESAIKITDGDLDTEIFIIDKGMLSEHSKTINSMSEQLKQKIKELEYEEQCKNEMLSALSHEVKTPLTSLILASELIKTNESSSSEETSCADIIKTNSERLNNLILSIIDISKLEHKSIDKYRNFSNFRLEDCILSAVNNSKIFANNTAINFKQERSISIYADFQLIETAITNILTNAIKYSKSDSIDITASQTDIITEIRIKDYGIGIPEEHLTKIFDKFYRVDKNRSRELGGSGLGLSIVKQIINLHNGTIDVKSDDGCEFIIRLPLN